MGEASPPIGFGSTNVEDPSSVEAPSELAVEARNPWQAAALGAFAFSLFLTAMLRHWSPYGLRQIEEGLDPGWTAVLAEAAGGRYAFGGDVIFTGGPLSYFYTKYYRPELLTTFLLLSWMMIAYTAAAMSTLAIRSRSTGFTGLLLGILVFTFPRDSLFLLVPLLTGLVLLQEPRSTWSRALFVFGTVCTSLCTLSKFSLLPLSLITFAVADWREMRERRLPFASALYVVTFVAAFYGFEGREGTLASFVTGSLATSSGYAEAMSVASRPSELAWLGVGIAGFAIGSCVFESSVAASSRGRWRDFLVQSLPFAAYVWISFKAGFVRSDVYHVMTAFSAIPIGGGLFALARKYRARRSPIPALVVSASMASGIVAMAVIFRDHGQIDSPRVFATSSVAGLRNELDQTVGAIRRPTAWRRSLDAARATALDRLRRSTEVGELSGSVATIEWNQSTLLATDVDFVPFPSVQEYTSYTEYVIERDLEFLRSRRSPDFVLFRPNTIDSRLPALAQGPAWPDLLSRYAPERMYSGTLLLAKRRTPLPTLLGSESTGRGRLGRFVRLPQGDGPVFLAADVRLSWLGRLRNFFYKVPRLRIRLRFEDGRESTFRYIRQIGRAGFLVSPFVASATDFLRLAGGVGFPLRQRVREFRISPENDRYSAFDMEFSYVTRRLGNATLATDASRWGSDQLTNALRSAVVFDEIVASNGGPSETMYFVPEGLLVHPDQTIDIASDGGTRIRARYGIRPEAYSNGPETDGVCFALYAEPLAAEIFRDCIRPMSDESDRGDQSFDVEIPEGTSRLRLKVGSGGTLVYDWFYLRSFDVVR